MIASMLVDVNLDVINFREEEKEFALTGALISRSISATIAPHAAACSLMSRPSRCPIRLVEPRI